MELSRLAVEQLFVELDIHPAISCLPSGVVVFEGPNIRIFAADIFSLTPDVLGSVDIVYDRAALVALLLRWLRSMRITLRILPKVLISFWFA